MNVGDILLLNWYALLLVNGLRLFLLEYRVPDSEGEIGGRGGIQLYYKVKIIETSQKGWISRTGDNLPPFFNEKSLPKTDIE